MIGYGVVGSGYFGAELARIMNTKPGLTVKVAVKPEVKIGAYNGLTVEKTVHTVSDEAVEAELKRVQERNARELTREGAAENGDIVDIDFEGFVDGSCCPRSAPLCRTARSGSGIWLRSGRSRIPMSARAAADCPASCAIWRACRSAACRQTAARRQGPFG